MANILLFLLPAVLGLLVPQPAAAVNRNYLLSGQTIYTNGRLIQGDYDLVMQDDCNLVLYNGGWQSDTANSGKDCKLTLNNFGQLLIQTGAGNTVWTSGPAASKSGNYAAVLHPEGKLLIYGPEVWSPTGPIAAHGGVWLQNTPLTRNVLFSGQVLYNGGRLADKNYFLVMQNDCNLVLYNGGFGRPGWQSNTHANDKFCFLRLNYQGELTIKDDTYRTIWSRGGTNKQGYYVFILQDDGRTVLYGPSIWASAPLTVNGR